MACCLKIIPLPYPVKVIHPTTLKKFFALTPSKIHLQILLALAIMPHFFIQNTNFTIQSVQANFGEGYTTLTTTETNHTYTDSTGLHLIKLKATLSNGEVYETQMVVFVRLLLNNNAQNRYPLADLNNPEMDIAAVPGVHEGCKVYIRRCINTPIYQIRKPLIVVEGFDIHDAAPRLASNYDVNKFINELRNTIVQNTPNDFSTQLDDVANYDLVFIDWKNGAGDIRGNAAALEQVITQINNMKALSGSTQQNVVMGISMGGLISRYCLASMTKRNMATGTRLLLTMDSPHQGAYVPLAFQHMVRGLQNVRVLSFIRLGSIFHHSLDQANDVLSSVGAQQQLKMTVTNADGNVAPNTFLNDIYRPMITFSSNDPQPTYLFKAVSNGSQCGVSTIVPGSSLITGTASTNLTALALILDYLIKLPVITKLKFYTEVQANTLTGSSSHKILSYKLQKKIQLFFIVDITKTYANLQRYEPSFNTIPWESVPAGYESLGQRLGSTTNTLEDDWSLIAPWFLGYQYNFTIAPNFGFVPVVSSLDIQNPSSLYNQYIFAANGQSGSTSTKYVAQEYEAGGNVYNTHHTDFFARNSRWIFNEMENTSQPGDCFDQCPPNSGYGITGPSVVCTNGTYNVSNLPTNMVVGWNLTSIGLATLSVTGNTATITALPGKSGYLTLSAAPHILNCNALYPLTKKIYIGIPKPVTGLMAEDITVHCSFVDVRLTPIGGDGATTFKWYTNYTSNPGFTLRSTSQKSGAASLSSPTDCTEVGIMRVDAVNACGINLGTSYTEQVGGTCYPYDIPNCLARSAAPPQDSLLLQVSPNPASNLITAELKYTVDYKSDSKSTTDLNIQKIIIVNNVGILVLTKKGHNNPKMGINVYKLTAGNYTLSAYNGQRWISCTIIKQ